MANLVEAADSDSELGKMTEAAIGVLAETDTDDPELIGIEELPMSVLQARIAAAVESFGVPLADARVLADMTTRSESAPHVARTVLTSLSSDVALSEEISDAYSRRAELMVIDPLTISAAALLLLTLKIRRVKVSRQGVDISLDPLKQGMIQALLSSISGSS